MASEEQIVKEIVEKTQDYESTSDSFYNQHREISDYFRNTVKARPKQKNKGVSSAVISEITRAVETLGTIFWKMLTAHDPNLYILRTRPNITD